MLFNTLLATAAKAAPAAAQTTAAAGQQQTQTNPIGMLVLMTGAFILMFWMMSRSNKKQQQKRQEMLDRIVKGTKVLLNSGVYGKVYEVREKEFVALKFTSKTERHMFRQTVSRGVKPLRISALTGSATNSAA